MQTGIALPKELEESAHPGDHPDEDRNWQAMGPARVHDGSPNRVELAALLKQRRNDLGLTQQLLARKLGVRASHVALLENGKRRPSLALLVRLAAVLSIDGKELLELAYPEVRTLIAPPPKPRAKLGPSWQRLLKNTALLAHYHVTRQELEVLEHLGMLGGKLTV